MLFTLPFILLTMGLGVLVINAWLFLFVGKLVDGFHVAGFWSAFGGALVVSVTNWLASGFVRSSAKAAAPAKKKPDDVIDI
jgi:putative membrane protein